MEEIIISGDLVSLRSVSEVRKISTSDFYASVSLAAGMMTPILPQPVIFYAAKESRNVLVTHSAPQLRTLKVRYDSDEYEYTVRLPHVYFFHLYHYSAFEDLYVFGAKSQIQTLNEQLYLLPLKNLYSDCRVCLGRGLKFDMEGRLSGKIARVENHFWNSVFNSDLDSNYRGAAPADWDEDPLTYWDRLSENDDFDPCKEDWQQWKIWKEVVDDLLEAEA